MLDPQIRDLAQAKNFAALTVIPAGGHPMTHVMWVDADDQHILINTDIDRAKAKAMDADPRVTVAIWDAENPYRYAEVRGRVVGSVAGSRCSIDVSNLVPQPWVIGVAPASAWPHGSTATVASVELSDGAVVSWVGVPHDPPAGRSSIIAWRVVPPRSS